MQFGAWTASTDPRGNLALFHVSQIALEHLRPRLELQQGEIVEPDSDWQVKVAHATSLAITYTLSDHWQIILIIRFDGNGEQLVVSSSVQNLSRHGVALKSFEILHGEIADRQHPLTHAFTHGSSMAEMAWIRPLQPATSHGVAALTTPAGNHALLCGFLRLDDAFYEISLAPAGDGRSNFIARCPREGIVLEPDAMLTCADLMLQQGNSLRSLLRDYAGLVGRMMHARPQTHPRPIQTGWCSWYYYYGTETVDDVLNNVQAIRPLSDRLRVIQIDDGWNLPQPGAPRVWGDWLPGAKFPQGMRAVVDAIHVAGFEAGLWLAPFSADQASTLFKQHPDWMVLNDQGQPLIENNLAGLDLSHPEALDFIRATFERVFDEWGFDYVKIDFLVHGARVGRRHDPTLTSAESFRRGLQVIRDTAGPRKFILNCGSPFGPSIGIADGMRVGFDVSTRWAMLDPKMPWWPLGNCALLPAAHQSLARQWMHGAWWQNDPDCLLTRDYASAAEKKALASYGDGRFNDAPWGLTDEEAAGWTRLVWMLGGMTIVGENMTEFTGPRRDLLMKALPPHAPAGQWVDLYEIPNLWMLRAGHDGKWLGLFNLGEETLNLSFAASRLHLGPHWKFREWLSGALLEGAGDTIDFPPLPPHAGRIWETV